MLTEEGREIREGNSYCDVCKTWKDDCVVYSADDFDRVVGRGFVPPKECWESLALDARPPKRDAFGNEVVVISSDAPWIPPTAAEKQAGIRKWRDRAKNRDRDALLCPSCDGRARRYEGPSFFERLAKVFRK